MDIVQAERSPAPHRSSALGAPAPSSGRTRVVRRSATRVEAVDDRVDREADRAAAAVMQRLGIAAAMSQFDRSPIAQPTAGEATSRGGRIQRMPSWPAAGRDRAPTLQRISRSEHSIIRRKIGEGQSNKEVRNEADQRFVAGVAKDGKYSLQPMGGGSAIEVDATDEHYSVVGDIGDVALAEAIKPGENSAVAYDMVEWTAKMRSLLKADDFAAAATLLARMKTLLGGVPKGDGPALTNEALDNRLKALTYGKLLFRDYRTALLLPYDDVVIKFKAVIGEKRANLERVVKHNFATKDADALAVDLAGELRTDRRKPEMVTTLMRLIDEDKRSVDRSIAGLQRKAHEAEAPPVMNETDVAAVYKQSAVVKLGQDKARRRKYDAAIELAVKEGVEALEARTRAALLDHLEGPMEDQAGPTETPVAAGLDAEELEAARLEAVRVEAVRVAAETRRIADRIKAATAEQIIAKSIAKKSARLKHLFDERPDVFEGLGTLVPADVHATLVAIKKGEAHSIFEINDYVGDKLNDPLMQWIINKGIKVEVHATSTLASFARMKSQGFTDVIEVPSSHTGTRKYIVANPETGEAKVIFQTLQGESYAIQTVGAFMFYEIYQHGDLVGTIELKSAEPWRYKDFKARNVISHADGVARYLLQKKDETLTADVPYKGAPHKIDDDGAIVLDGVPASAIVVNKVAVKTLKEENLTILKEDVDYKKMYLDIMRSNGIKKVDIAAMGRKGELKRMLAEMGYSKPYIELTLPNFNATMYLLKAPEGKKRLVAFQLSPDFFGDRSGFLTEALKELGVQHITFVGTAGGLGKDVGLNDLLVPEELANVANTMPGDDVEVGKGRAKNKAFTALEELKKTAAVEPTTLKSGGLHVGVHSPITESMKMITWMKKTSVQSVDCEAGFIADALAASDVSLYAIYFIGDLPGTHHSIGMGGTASAEETAEGDTAPKGGKKKQETADSEKLVREIIKGIVKGNIEKADKEAPNIPKINKMGVISVVGGPKGTIPMSLKITVLEPEIAITGKMVGVLRTFAASLKDVKKDEHDRLIVTPEVFNQLNHRAREFYSTHKVKLQVELL